MLGEHTFKKINILHCIVSKNGTYGGGENIVKQFCIEKSISHNLTVITNSEVLLKELSALDNINLFYLKLRNLNIINFIIFTFKLFHISRKQKFELIFSHHRFSTIIFGILNIFLDFHLIHYIHYYSNNIKFITILCKNYVSVSNALRIYWEQTYGVNISQIRVIYNGVPKFRINVRRVNEFKNKCNLDFLKINLCILGRLSHLKGHKILIKAVDNIVKENKINNIKLYILGEGELQYELEHLVSQIGLTKNIIFTGFIDNPQEILSLFDIYVQPSLSEGLPFTLLEAMSASTLIIASDIAANKEVLTDTYPLLFKSGNVNDLSDKIINAISILNDDLKRSRIIQFIENQYNNKFTKEQMIINYNNYVNEFKR